MRAVWVSSEEVYIVRWLTQRHDRHALANIDASVYLLSTIVAWMYCDGVAQVVENAFQ